MSKVIPMVGNRFGKLVVVEYAGTNNRRKSLWRCLCDCGSNVVVMGELLRRGETKSCGCKKFKHGHYHKPWYSSYKSMMGRCYLKSSGNYNLYGGRGITVCDEWHDINKFSEWVESSGYAPGCTIDRIDVNGNYCPENCRWATVEVQANNKRNNIVVEVNGKTKTIAQLAKETRIPYATLWGRHKRGKELFQEEDQE